MALPLIPIAITLATLGGLYYTREPVAQLRQGKSYKIFVNVDQSLFQGGAGADTGAVAGAVQNFLAQAGFSPVRFRSSQRASTSNVTTYIYDGTWTKAEQFIGTPAAPGVAASFYEKLPLL